jgi:hypothetical protein
LASERVIKWRGVLFTGFAIKRFSIGNWGISSQNLVRRFTRNISEEKSSLQAVQASDQIGSETIYQEKDLF